MLFPVVCCGVLYCGAWCHSAEVCVLVTSCGVVSCGVAMVCVMWYMPLSVPQWCVMVAM